MVGRLKGGHVYMDTNVDMSNHFFVEVKIVMAREWRKKREEKESSDCGRVVLVGRVARVSRESAKVVRYGDRKRK